MMELTPVRVYLMYTIPVACLTLSFLLLYPEIVVRQRFKPAACKVTHIVPWNFLRDEARIINEVTVRGEDGEVVDIFGANACNPMDCVEGGPGFMDKKAWLRMYEEDKSYPCLYDPMRDRPKGFKWVVFDPVHISIYTWIFFVFMAAALVCVIIFHIRVKFVNGEFTLGAWKDSLGGCVRCMSWCTGWCQDKSAGLCAWRWRRRGYAVQNDMELEECEVHNDPPTYQAAREPPPSYSMVVLPGEEPSAEH